MAVVATLQSLPATQTLWRAGRTVLIAADGESTGDVNLDASRSQCG